MSDSAIIILTGALAAAACALPGTFLVLRGMSLLGDAISHAVLPGIVVAFLITGQVSSWPVVLGAGITGLLAVVLIEALTRTRRIKEDASIAVVFPALFALGVLLLAQYAGQKDLDQDCVLYGEIAYAPLDVITLSGGLEVARPTLVLGIVLAVNALLVGILYKELKIATFDPAFASAIGLSPIVIHYVLMASVSATTVASFESVGAILVVAFLIVPPAAAHLLTDRLPVLLGLAMGIGVASSAAGYYVASWLDASIAGCMAACMGVAFLLAWMGSPRHGFVSHVLRRRAIRRRFAAALVIERLARAAATAESVLRDLAWSTGRGRRLLDRLVREGLVEIRPEGLRATDRGIDFVRETGV